MSAISPPYPNLSTLPWERLEQITDQIEHEKHSSFVEILRKQELLENQDSANEILKNLAEVSRALKMQSWYELENSCSYDTSSKQLLWKAFTSVLDSIVDSLQLLFSGDDRSMFGATQQVNLLTQFLAGFGLTFGALTGISGSFVVAFLCTTIVVIAATLPIFLYALLRPMPETLLGFKNLTFKAQQNPSHLLIDREETMSQLQEFVQKRKHVLIVGESGVGKTALVHELAHCKLSGFHYLFCGNAHHLIPEMTHRHKFKTMQRRMGSEESATIIAMDEFHLIADDQTLRGDFLELLDRTAGVASCTFVGLTTPKGYRELKAKMEGLERRLHVIEVSSVKEQTALQIFKRHAELWVPEITIEKEALAALYKKNEAQPGMGIKILTEALVAMKTKAKPFPQYEQAKEAYMQAVGALDEGFTIEANSGLIEATQLKENIKEVQQKEAKLLSTICDLRRKLSQQKRETYRDAEAIEKAGVEDADQLRNRVLFKALVKNPALKREIAKAENALMKFREEQGIQEQEKEAAERPLLLTKATLTSIITRIEQERKSKHNED